MQNILFVDNWDKSVDIHILDLIELIGKVNYNYYFLHYDRFRDPNEKKIYQKNGLKVYDISYFQYSVNNSFNYIDPDLIIVFHTTFFIDRVVIDKAKENNIPTILLQIQSVSSEHSHKNINMKKRSKKFLKYSKILTFLIKNKYPPFKILKEMFKVSLNSKKFYYAPEYNETPIVDYYLIHSKKYYYRYYSKYYNDNIDKYIFTGNYEIDKFYTKYKNTLYDKEADKKIIYIDECLVNDNLVDKEKFKYFIKNLINLSKRVKTDLYIFLHPRTDKSFYKFINNQNVNIMNTKFDLINYRDTIIGHYSTLLYIFQKFNLNYYCVYFDNYNLIKSFGFNENKMIPYNNLDGNINFEKKYDQIDYIPKFQIKFNKLLETLKNDNY